MNTRLEINLTPAHLEQLRKEADRLGVPVAELARAAVIDLVSAPADEFTAAAEHVLQKNRELYKRLA